MKLSNGILAVIVSATAWTLTSFAVFAGLIDQLKIPWFGAAVVIFALIVVGGTVVVATSMSE